MHFLQTAKAWLDPSQIGYVIFYATNRCNFRCPFCFYYAEIEKGRKVNELTLEEITAFAKKLGPILQLSITGGEPFLRKDLADVYGVFAEHCGAPYITIPTNAALTDKMLAFLKRVLPKYPNNFLRLTFSVDGIEGEHDKNRAAPGSFAKIQKSYAAIAPLREKYPNLVLDANSVFTSDTEDHIIDIVNYLDANFDFDNLSVTYARGNIKDASLKSDAKEKYEALNRRLEELERKKEKRRFYYVWRGVRDVSRQNLIKTVFEDKFVTPCVAGKKLVVVSETGDLHPCEVLDKPFGNLRDFDFDPYRLLMSEKGREINGWIKQTQCKCSFECALGANVVWNPSQYSEIVKSAIRNIG